MNITIYGGVGHNGPCCWGCLNALYFLQPLKTLNKSYDRSHPFYDAALTQHALRPLIDPETNHKRHFIKCPFINKGIEFID